MTRPCRRITLHLSQIGLTLGFTFTAVSVLFFSLGVALLVPVHDAAPGQVVGRQLHHHAILGQDADVVLPHLAADVGEHLVAVLQLNAKHGIGQGLDHATLDLYGAVLFGHYFLAILVLVNAPGWARSIHSDLKREPVTGSS